MTRCAPKAKQLCWRGMISQRNTKPSRKKRNGSAREQRLDVGVTINDFRAYMPTHSYIFEPSRDTWPASSVNSRITADPGPRRRRQAYPRRKR